ncbi:MAG: Rne/Rng family ribonuclease [Bacteroidales bacterium]|nr:Rne/Rng family ribonuclease [Bacteroidales bacterium]MDD7725941.1 Rne/Rng family ribonuclease [Bacteroidales bacterium]MDY4174058.1 Rne/Rng family ribonuclease [Bacteroidales bacterium]
MNAELFINVTPDEMVIALTEDKRLVELRREKRNVQFEVGDIYIGKVRKVMQGLNAAFVSVGYEKDAFLHYLDLGPQFKTQQKFLQQVTQRKNLNELPRVKREEDIDKKGSIVDVLQAGEEVLVQVAKEPISTKGPRLTSEISLAGRNLVLMPFADKISVSKKIRSAEERTRLKKIVQQAKPKDMGVIIRTVAEGQDDKEIADEIVTLVKRWDECVRNVKTCRPPAKALGEMERAATMIRDLFNPDFNNIYVNDKATFEEIKNYVTQIAPDKSSIVKLYTGKLPIFDNFNIEKQIKLSCGKAVSFKSGAYLIIETTEALNVIDVNSGNKSKTASNQENNALETNLAAADEIARQLRLRDMGGIVVIDFIDMQSADNRNKLYERMKEAMAKDKTKHNILPLSKFGLMQITRQRVRPVMTIDTTETCPTCGGSGKIQTSVQIPDLIEAAVAQEASKHDKKFTVRCHPFIYAYLKKGFPSKILKWKLRYGITRLRIQPSASLGIVDFKIDEQH